MEPEQNGTLGRFWRGTGQGGRDELELRHPYRGQSFSMAPDIALASAELPEPFHRDPADRLIVAQPRRSRATLVTADRKILAYPHVKTAPWE